MKTTNYEKLAKKFEESIESRVEYETEHSDAGENYSHLLREGGWDYGNGKDRLIEWMAENEFPILDETQMESLIDEILDWSEYEAGHIFSSGTTKEKFIVDSFHVGEVEDQYSFDDLCDLLDISEKQCADFVKLAKEDNRFCLRDNGDGGVLSYTNTDAVWMFCIDKEWMNDRLESLLA